MNHHFRQKGGMFMLYFMKPDQSVTKLEGNIVEFHWYNNMLEVYTDEGYKACIRADNIEKAVDLLMASLFKGVIMVEGEIERINQTK
jgi:hypothetical protein